MTKLLCLTTKTRIVNRYLDRKLVDRARLPEPAAVDDSTLAELEDFRANGRVHQEPQTA